MSGETFTLWRECPGHKHWRLQTSDPETAKVLERDRRFTRTCSAVVGNFLRVYRFAARDQHEARTLLEKVLPSNDT